MKFNLNVLASMALTALMIVLMLLATLSYSPSTYAATGAPSAEASKTEILEKIGNHKRCGLAPGLAGWLVRNRTVWSLEKTLETKGDEAVKGVIISFFATWCQPCKAGLPKLQSVQSKAKAAGVPMILVAVPEFTMDVAKFLDEIGVKIPTVKDKFAGILKQWLIGRKEGKDNLSLPRTVLVNDDQQIVQIYGQEGDDFAARVIEDAKRVSTLCRPGGQ